MSLRNQMGAALSTVILLVAVAPAGDRLPVQGVQITLLQEVAVPARQAGVLRAIRAKEGKSFAAGDVLGTLEDREAKLQLKKAELELAVAAHNAARTFDLDYAQKAWEVATRNHDRAKQSVARVDGSISDADLDRYKLDAEKAANDRKNAGADIELAKLMLQLKQNGVDLAQDLVTRHQLVAPFQGVVVELKKQPGDWVEPGDGVLRIVRLDVLKVEGFVLESQIIRDLTGSNVSLIVTTARGSARYAGKVTFVSPEIEPTTKQVRIVAEVANDDLSLKPGLQAAMTVDP